MRQLVDLGLERSERLLQFLVYFSHLKVLLFEVATSLFGLFKLFSQLDFSFAQLGTFFLARQILLRDIGKFVL